MKRNILSTLMLLICLLLNLNNCNLKSNEDLNIEKELKTNNNSELGFQSDEGSSIASKQQESELEKKKREEQELKQEEAKYDLFKKQMGWYHSVISTIYNYFTGFISYVDTYGKPIINIKDDNSTLNNKTWITKIKERYEEENQEYGLKKNKENIIRLLQQMIQICMLYNIETTKLSEIKEKFNDKTNELEDKFSQINNEAEEEKIQSAAQAAVKLAELYNEKIETIAVKSYVDIYKNIVLTANIFKTEKFQKKLREEFESKIDGTSLCLTGNTPPINCRGSGGDKNKDLLP